VNGLAAIPTKNGRIAPGFANRVGDPALKRALEGKAEKDSAETSTKAKPAKHAALFSRTSPSTPHNEKEKNEKEKNENANAIGGLVDGLASMPTTGGEAHPKAHPAFAKAANHKAGHAALHAKKEAPKAPAKESVKESTKDATSHLRKTPAPAEKAAPVVKPTPAAKPVEKAKPAPKSGSTQTKKNEEANAIGGLVDGLAAMPTTKGGKIAPGFANKANHPELRKARENHFKDAAKPVKKGQHKALLVAQPSVWAVESSESKIKHSTQSNAEDSDKQSADDVARAQRVQKAMQDAEKVEEDIDALEKVGKQDADEGHKIAQEIAKETQSTDVEINAHVSNQRSKHPIQPE